MKRFLLLFLILGALFSTVGRAQEKPTTFKLKDYVSNRVGDTWQYKNLAPDGLSPIVVKVAAEERFKNKTVTRRTENNGDYRLQRLDGDGLKIYQLYFVGDRRIEYEKPVLLMPAKLRLGVTHNTETRYQTFVKGELKERGTQKYTTIAERVETIKTAFGEYPNSLVIRTLSLRVDDSGTKKGYDLREWHALGVGAVKITGELYWTNAQGERTRTFKIDAELENKPQFGISERAFTAERKSVFARFFSRLKRLFK